MTDFRTQTRRVRMKGGADVRVLRPAQESEPQGLHAVIVRNARMIFNHSRDGSDLDGFVLIGLYSDGTSSMGYRAPERLPRALLVAYLDEILRRDIIVENEARCIFDDKFEWRE